MNKYIVLHETLWQSFARDLISFASVVATVGLGVAIGSVAMQWVGAIVFFLIMIVRGSKHYKPMTLDQAAEYIERLRKEGEAE